jgi:hypothetical protein
MPLYGPSTATATVTANTNVVSITGMDLNAVVQQGMTINLGARDRAVGDAWIINTVVPNGTNGGTLTTAGSIPTAYNSAPFLIDTRGFNGTDSSFAAAVSLKLLATLTNLLGTATNLFAGSRQLVLDKVASTAIGRIAFAITGRTWGDIAHRSHTYTPTGGQAATIETLAVRAFPDGATPTDALLFDLGSGTGDLRKGSATMVAASTVDLGSAPMGKVAIAGGAGVNINSFGPGKHLDRLVHFVSGGATLVHNAASLDLEGGTNIVTRAGDRLHATSDGAGNWRVHRYTRAIGAASVGPFRTGGYAALATQQSVTPADYGRSFSWAIASSYVLLPLGSSVFPGWWCQIKFDGNPINYGESSVVTPGYTDLFKLNGIFQFADTAQSVRGFIVIGGGEEFRFTWSGAEWLIEIVQSPAIGHFVVRRAGSGGYAATPTAVTLLQAATTVGTNTVAAAAYGIGMYAPCDGIYRLRAAMRFFNNNTGQYEGNFGLGSSVFDPEAFAGSDGRNYRPGDYQDMRSVCTKRLRFGQIVAAYKVASNTELSSSGAYETFTADLLSRG